MSSAVKDGVLKVLSPSMLDSFDASSAFGCPRRGYYKYVLGEKEPTTAAMTLGTHIHAMNEAYLKDGSVLDANEEQMRWFKAGRWYLDEIRPRVTGIEAPVVVDIEGVPVSTMSKCDVVLTDAIVDWKTSSSVSKYGKTPGQLANNTQLLVYAKAFHPDTEEVSLVHGYYQTKGATLFEPVKVTRTKKQLRESYDNVIVPLVALVRETVALKTVEETKLNLSACRMCPHQTYCSRGQKDSFLMSFFTRKPASSAAPAASLLAEGLHASAPQSSPDRAQLMERSPGLVEALLSPGGPAILPPDAPKSDPALAADPVEGWSPPTGVFGIANSLTKDDPELAARVQAMQREGSPEAAATPPVAPLEVKRGRGRPKGSVNKPKDTYNAAAATTAFIEEINMPSKHTVEKMTVTYGLTLGLPNYSSVRFDVSLVATVDGDAASVYDALLNDVKAKVSAEIEKVQAQTKGGK